MFRLRHDSFGLDGSTTLREASGSIPSGGLTDFGGPSFPLAIANKNTHKNINVYPKWMKYEPTDV